MMMTHDNGPKPTTRAAVRGTRPTPGACGGNPGRLPQPVAESEEARTKATSTERWELKSRTHTNDADPAHACLGGRGTGGGKGMDGWAGGMRATARRRRRHEEGMQDTRYAAARPRRYLFASQGLTTDTRTGAEQQRQESSNGVRFQMSAIQGRGRLHAPRKTSASQHVPSDQPTSRRAK